jgi:hypothetical protein
LVHVGRVNGTFQFTFEILALKAHGDGLPVARARLFNGVSVSSLHNTHFFAVKNIFPSRRGRRGMIRSSARKSAFSRSRARRASNDLNFPLSFSMPTTRLMNRTPACSRRSLYSRCGSFVMRQIADERGSTRGYLIGLFAT